MLAEVLFLCAEMWIDEVITHVVQAGYKPGVRGDGAKLTQDAPRLDALRANFGPAFPIPRPVCLSRTAKTPYSVRMYSAHRTAPG